MPTLALLPLLGPLLLLACSSQPAQTGSAQLAKDAGSSETERGAPPPRQARSAISAYSQALAKVQCRSAVAKETSIAAAASGIVRPAK